MQNPLNSAYEAIITSLRDNSLIRDVIRTGNLIVFNELTAKPKSGISTADVPELVMYPSNIKGNLHASSSHCFLTVTWRFMISTGSYRTNIVNDCTFAVLQTLVNWHTTIKLATWNEVQFIKDVRLSNADLGVSNPDANRNIKGWATVLDAETDFALDLAQVKAANT